MLKTVQKEMGTIFWDGGSKYHNLTPNIRIPTFMEYTNNFFFRIISYKNHIIKVENFKENENVTWEGRAPPSALASELFPESCVSLHCHIYCHTIISPIICHFPPVICRLHPKLCIHLWIWTYPLKSPFGWKYFKLGNGLR